MKPYFAISPLLMTLVMSGAAAQDLPKMSEHPSFQPLNLSVRKAAVPATEPALLIQGNQANADGQTSLGSASSDDADHQVRMRYGSGYESRNQGTSGGDSSSGADGKSGKSDSDSDGGKSSGKGEGKGGGKGEGKGKGGSKGH